LADSIAVAAKVSLVVARWAMRLAAAALLS
jgi:hypothetical protein